MFSRSLFLFLSACLVLVLGLSGCGSHGDPWKHAKPGQKRVLAVTPALYCFASNVAGDRAAVLCLLSNKGPHDYDPTPADAYMARKADLFLANGLELDEFVTRIASISGNKHLEIYRAAEALPHEDLHHPEHDHGAEGHHHHHHGDHDPHVWLAPELAKKLTHIIADKLGKMDPANQEAYQENAKVYGATLDKLIGEGKEAFANKKNKKIVTLHESMGYFADAFGIEVAAVIHPKPGFEAEPSRIRDIAKICREKDVQVICVEPQYSRSSAETLQKNLKGEGVEIRIVDFDPLETAPPNELNAELYERRMRQNIKLLAEALQ